jgi:SAM-dependent methyltransferase
MAPATARNREHITKVLSRHLPLQGLVLEVASGTGEHITHFARALSPGLVSQPSDPDAGARASIDAWVKSLRVGNVLPAIALDASTEDWPIKNTDAVLCINMIHIAPWEAAVGLVCGAARVLPVGGLLYLYGPYRRGGQHTSPSNETFDCGLRMQNSEWGVRDLESVVQLADEQGSGQPLIEEMPANNLSLVFYRSALA